METRTNPAVEVVPPSDIRGGVRCSNFELLRILSMLMIVVYHIMLHCVEVSSISAETT